MRYFLSVFFTFFTICLQAQNVSVVVECPRIVRVGEAFQMSVSVNANSSTPKLPEMPVFSVLRGPDRSQSSQISVVNNNVTQSMNLSFSYVLQANQEGTHEIPSVEVTVDKKNYQSQPVRVQVVAGTASAQTDNSQVKSDNRDIFLSVIPNRTKIYQGENIDVTIKLFSKLDISSLNDLKLPNFEGFYKKEIETPPLRGFERELVNGVIYGSGILRRYVLFPQKSGILTIAPGSIEAGIAQRVQTRSRSVFDDFFGSTQTIPREVKSHPVEITVMPLPEGKPSSFTGGVGQLKMNAVVDKTEVKANDPIALKVTISGTGNMKFMDVPRINFPPDFEVYDPKITTNLNITETSGSKTFEYLIIPRHGGMYKLPSVEFSYFDPQDKQYKTLRSEEYTLTVEKGDEQPGTTVVSGITREDVKFLGKDIRYIKSGNLKLRKSGDYFFGTWKFWLWYVVPLVAFVVIVYFRRKYIRKSANAAFMKNRRAGGYAARRLKQARVYMDKGQSSEMYEELSRALWGYLSDKLDIPVAELSKENGRLMMEQHQVDAALADEFVGVIDDCEFARYAPSAEGMDMKTLYDRAVEVISKMQKAI